MDKKGKPDVEGAETSEQAGSDQNIVPDVQIYRRCPLGLREAAALAKLPPEVRGWSCDGLAKWAGVSRQHARRSIRPCTPRPPPIE
jgi:hypothetical protein